MYAPPLVPEKKVVLIVCVCVCECVYVLARCMSICVCVYQLRCAHVCRPDQREDAVGSLPHLPTSLCERMSPREPGAQ